MRTFWLSILMVMLSGMAAAQSFPSGMTWKEILVAPGSEDGWPTDPVGNEFVYEIGTDTVINTLTYKKVIKNGVEQPIWVRESDNKVYLLTAEYPHELKLYDFNWDGETGFSIDYLVEAVEDGTISAASYDVPAAFNVTFNDNPRYEFHNESYGALYGGTVIRGLGRVAEKYRNGSLLGYKKLDVPLPSALMFKVQWVKRGGETVFNSSNTEEWVTSFPESAEYHYVPLVREGVQWTHIRESMFYGHALGTTQPYIETFEISGDTVVNNITYKKVCSTHSSEPPALIRETGKKVYANYPLVDEYNGTHDEYLIYDFNAPGAGFETERRHYAEDMVDVGGTFRKAYYFMRPGSGERDNRPSFIEGIGTLRGTFSTFFDPWAPMPEDGTLYELTHVTENGEVVYRTMYFGDYEYFVEHGIPLTFADVNHDKVVNVADISTYYKYMLNGSHPYDINGDNEVNVADVSALYKVILQ